MIGATYATDSQLRLPLLIPLPHSLAPLPARPDDPLPRVVDRALASHEDSAIIQESAEDGAGDGTAPRAPEEVPPAAPKGVVATVTHSQQSQARAQVSGRVESGASDRAERHPENGDDQPEDEGAHACSGRGVGVVSERQDGDGEDRGASELREE